MLHADPPPHRLGYPWVGLAVCLVLAHTRSKPAAQYCAGLLPAVQALVKTPLVVKSADDASSDVMHTGEPGYVACVFSSGAYQVSIILSDDPEKRFTDASRKSYVALPGFGDVARAHKGSMTWVDVMKGSHFCEAIDVLPDEALVDADWTHGAAKICVWRPSLPAELKCAARHRSA